MPGAFTWPLSILSLKSRRWPVLFSSNSGSTPASRIATAMASRCDGVLMKTCGPIFMLPISRLQMSGLSATTWRTRRPGGEVDEDVAAACPDPVHDLCIEGNIPARPRGLGIAHVDVNDGRARLGR